VRRGIPLSLRPEKGQFRALFDFNEGFRGWILALELNGGCHPDFQNTTGLEGHTDGMSESPFWRIFKWVGSRSAV